ncbi:hypothetical protein [Haliangium sp.]|uniref:hypothetical protein n=1 Tax=Haliangium sp. TaxID=2663208 RepID=UPI003D105235
MDIDIRDFVKLPAYTVQRRVFICTQVAEAARGRGLDDLTALAERAIAHDSELMRLRHKRRRRQYRKDTVAIDQQLDRSVGGLDRFLASQLDVYGPDHPRGHAAAKLRARMLPRGVAALTKQSFVEQHVAVDSLLDIAAEPELAPLRATMPELDPMFDRIHELNQAYGDRLDEDHEQVSAERLHSMNQRGQALIAAVVAAVFAHVALHAPDDTALLTALMRPVVEQSRALRIERRRRRWQRRRREGDDGDGDEGGDELGEDGGGLGDEPGLSTGGDVSA